MSKGAKSPPPRDLAQEISSILSQGPALLRSEQSLSPEQVGLDLSNLELALYGTPAGTRTLTNQVPEAGWLNTQTGQFSATDPALDPANAFPNKGGGQGMGRAGQPTWIPYTRQTAQTQTVDTPAQRGLYDLLQSGTERFGQIQNEANTASRTATYNDLRRLNPGQASLYDLLTADAAAGIKAGDRLTPEETFNTVNPVRANWAARGLGNSAPGQLDEAVNLVTAGRGVGQQRRGNAASTAQLGNQLYTAPALAFAPDTTGGAQNFLGYGGGYGQQPNILQQLGGYGSDLFNTNFNAEAASNISKANARNANTQAAVGTALTVAPLLFCWAAREVYGAQDPRWLQFRHWLLNFAPAKLRRWYVNHGPRWAERLHNHPPAKATVRRWMDRRLGKEFQHAL